MAVIALEIYCSIGILKLDYLTGALQYTIEETLQVHRCKVSVGSAVKDDIASAVTRTATV